VPAGFAADARRKRRPPRPHRSGPNLRPGRIRRKRSPPTFPRPATSGETARPIGRAAGPRARRGAPTAGAQD